MTGLRRAVGCIVLSVFALAGCHDGETRKGLGAFSANPEVLDFGAVALGRDRIVEVTLTNESRVPYNVSEVSATVPNVEVIDFAPMRLGGGESKVIRVRFAPEVEGEVTGALSIATDDVNAGGTLPFDGRGVRAYVDVNAQALDFGRVDIDTSKVLTLSVSNPTSVETFLRFGFEGANADEFTSSDADRDLSLAPGEVRTLSVAFKPALVGLADAVARFSVCPACEPVAVTLLGEGITGAVEIFPTRLEFGRVSLGATASQKVMIRNNGNKDITLSAASLDAVSTGEGALAVQPEAGLPLTVTPNGETWVTVSYTPTAPGTLQGRYLALGILTDNAINPKLAITGEAGQSCVALLPKELDFGVVPEGMSATRRVDVYNRCNYDVQVTDARTTATVGGYFSLGQLVSLTVVPAGRTASLQVTYTPKPGETLAQGTLTVKVTEQSALSTVQIPMVGTSKVFQPCSWTISPGALDFGAVPVGAAVTLAVSVTNVGSDQCFLGGMQLASGSDGAFTAEPVNSTVLEVGQSAMLKITFRPQTAGLAAALAEAWVNNPTNNHPTATVRGNGVSGCFALQPTDVDFGTAKLSCGARTRSVLAYNACQAPVTIQQASIDTNSSNDFGLGALPGLPMTLQAGQQTQLTVTYDPRDEGGDAAALRVTVDGTVYTAGLIGSGMIKPTRTDTFVQDSQSKVDVLFVIDNSGSMMEEQQSLGQNFAAFLSAAQSQAIDYHIGVTTTGIDPSPGGWSVCPGGADGGEAGRLFPVSGATPRIITPQTPNAASVFATNVNVGWCHWNEQGLEGAYRALSPPLVNSADDTRTPVPNDGNAGFLRQEAKLAIVFVSDEDDAPTQPVSFYETFFKSLKPDPTMLSISAIVGPANLATCPTASSAGTRYIALATATGGVVESICTADWAKSLQNLSLSAFGPKRRFPLSEAPADAAALVVEVNGSPATGWTYDRLTNSIVFDEQSAPAAGSVVQITYPLGC